MSHDQQLADAVRDLEAILTWRERRDEYFAKDGSLSVQPNSYFMEKEIAELRAALGRAVAPSEPVAQVVCNSALRAEPAELDFLEEWLRFAEEPVGMVCCGMPTTGAQYMGQTEMVCCGNGEPSERSAVEVIEAMQARHKVLTAEVLASRCRAQGGDTKTGCLKCPRDPAKVCGYCGLLGSAATPGDAAKGE